MADVVAAHCSFVATAFFALAGFFAGAYVVGKITGR